MSQDAQSNDAPQMAVLIPFRSKRTTNPAGTGPQGTVILQPNKRPKLFLAARDGVSLLDPEPYAASSLEQARRIVAQVEQEIAALVEKRRQMRLEQTPGPRLVDRRPDTAWNRLLRAVGF
ncbi:MAG: hypothetical protein PW735_09205 [Acidobacteriaceae bacterium]|nr:hypothetical protein [Acidobacteriaceae bacterium]